MTAENLVSNFSQQPPARYQNLIQGNYSEAARAYEDAIQAQPDVRLYYWYLGLSLLLQGQEAEAQTTWFLAMAEGETEQIEQWTAELLEVLETEAKRREQLEDYSIAWVLRQHIREVDPSEINNLLQIIDLSIKLNKFTGNELNSLNVIQSLQSQKNISPDPDLLLKTLKKLLVSACLEPFIPDFVAACVSHLANYHQKFINIVISAAVDIAYSEHKPTVAAQLADICLRLEPENLEVLSQLAPFYQSAGKYKQGIETAKLCYSLSKTLPEKIFATFLVIRGLMSAAGYWQEAISIFKKQELYILDLIQGNNLILKRISTLRIINVLFFQPYFRDDLKKNRWLQNQVSHIFKSSVQDYAKEQIERYRQQLLTRKASQREIQRLKIGYISYCLRTHSVGWLARWLIEYHDRDRFQVYTYFVGYKSQDYDPLQEWFAERADCSRKLAAHSFDIAEQIQQDKIDILIDLDSITLDTTCEVMALKPAPIQVTWLGWDASGLGTIDYFIADPYVLPDWAQEHYREKIWRLPQTYVAVDGFTVGIPTLRREHLDIPDDAIVYFCGQKGYKRHPHTIRLKMQILKEVPNSYLLIKGLADQESIKNFFNHIAQEEGVDCNRLRFLPEFVSESIHRANLGIADVVLDTYPYNGATTTLETLWMCIPLVTRVGEQFSARNSYTMMMNAGITEGIAWTDEEYVEWGVRLGKDEALRQNLAWKLRESRQTAPLWNARQFTREIEKAYTQMWQNYIETHQ